MRIGKEPSIAKAYFSLFNRAISIEEYEELIRQDPYYSGYVLTCEKCGDPISYVPAGKKISFFRHSPGGDNHDCCPLYHEGMSSENMAVFTMHKTFMDEEGISLNFEISLEQGNWSSLIALPPFDADTIAAYSERNISIQIRASDGRDVTDKTIHVTAEQFQPGVIVRLPISGFPCAIQIFSKTNGAKMQDEIGGFRTNKSLFSPLIRYDESVFDAIKKGCLTLKRHKAGVFTHRHYLIFEQSLCSSPFTSDEADWTLISRVPGPEGTKIYDVEFKQISQQTQRFCANCGCHLEDKEELVVIWPPVRSLGDYRFYSKRVSEDGKISKFHQSLFVAVETETEVLDLMKFKTNGLFFGVKNNGCLSFNVTKEDEKASNKKDAQFTCDAINDVTSPYALSYLYKNGALIRSLNREQIQLKRGQLILVIDSPLSIHRYEANAESVAADDFHGKLKEAILYSFGTQEISSADCGKYLEIYEEDAYVCDYLRFCQSCHAIKKSALAVLEGTLHHEN